VGSVKATSTSASAGTFAAYASTDCSGDAVGSTSNQDCLNVGSLNVKVQVFSTLAPVYGLIATEWVGSTECSSQAPGAMWLKSYAESDCVFFTVHQGNVFYRQFTCNCSTYGQKLYSDSTCSTLYPMAMPDNYVSPCTASDIGSTAYPYERARTVTCGSSTLECAPSAPAAPTSAPTLAPTTDSPTPAPEGEAVVVQATVSLSGITMAQFDDTARYAFRTVTALSIGSLCGVDGTSLCTAEDVRITAVSSRRASGLSVQFDAMIAESRIQTASQTLNSAVSDGSLLGSLKESNQNLAQITGMDFTPDGQPTQALSAAPVVRTTMQCFNGKFAKVESGGLSPVQLSSFGWSEDTLQGFVQTESCSGGSCSSAMSSSSSKSTCTVPPGDGPVSCVSYEVRVQATNQSDSHLAYNMRVATCGASTTCDALLADAEDSVVNMDEAGRTTVETILGCNICTTDLCNTVAWPSTQAAGVEESSVGVTAYIGIGVGLVVCVTILFFLLRSVGQSCSQHGEPAYKQAAEE